MKRFWLFFLVLLLVPLVSAQQPPFVQESEVTEPQLQINIPKNEFFEVRDSATMHFHVFNSTGGLVTNETVDCHLHIYNLSGSHVTEVDLEFDSNGEEWFIGLNSSDHTHTIGFIPYIVWCNSSTEAGFLSSTFEVNRNSSLERNDVLVLVVMIVGLLFFFLYLANTFKDSTKWFHQSVRLLLILSCLWLMVALGGLGVAYANEFSLPESILTVVQVLYFVLVYSSWLFSFLLVIYFLYEVLMAFRYKTEREHEELLGK